VKRTRARSTLLALAIAAAITAFAAPPALAIKHHGMRIVPAPNEIQQASFLLSLPHPKFTASSGHNVECESAFGSANFYNAEHGKLSLTFSGCALQDPHHYPCKTEGAKTGEISTGLLPIYLAQTITNTYVVVINPNQEQGPPPTIFVPKINCDGLFSLGPITGQPTISITPLNVTGTTFTAQLTGPKKYVNETDPTKYQEAWVRWTTSFLGVEEAVTPSSESGPMILSGHPAEFEVY
jgi:hypothetical protein